MRYSDLFFYAEVSGNSHDVSVLFSGGIQSEVSALL